MNEFVVVTPCFAPSRLLRESMKDLYGKIKKNFQHYVLWNHYPINKESEEKEIKKICEEYGLIFIDTGGDIGLSPSLTKWFLNFRESKESKGIKAIIGFDPDEKVTSPDHFEALACVASDPRVAVAASWLPGEILNVKEKLMVPAVIKNVRAWFLSDKNGGLGIEMFCLVAWNYNFIDRANGFFQSIPYYGAIESEMYKHMKIQMRGLYYLPDYKESTEPFDQSLFDAKYREWKTWIVDQARHGIKGYSFAEFLEKHK